MVGSVKRAPPAAPSSKAKGQPASEAAPDETALKMALEVMRTGARILTESGQAEPGLQWRYQPVAERTDTQADSRKVVIDTTQFLISGGAVPTQELKVENPIYRTRPQESARHYEGYYLIDLLRDVPQLENINAIHIRAEDHFVTKFEDVRYDPKSDTLTAKIGNERVDIGQGFVAIRDLSARDSSDGSELWDALPPKMKDGKEVPRGTPENRTPGPAWLVFPNDHPLHDKTIYWPYQARTIELISR